MIDFLILPGNLAFAVSLAIVLVIGILEGLLLLVGVGFLSLLDTVVPGDGVEIDIDSPDLNSANSLGRIFSWLRYKNVPVIIMLIVLLTAFGLIGLVLQGLIYNVFGALLPLSIAASVAFLVSLPVTRICNSILIKVMPSDESSAVSLDSFVGRLAIIYQGEAKKNSPAQARVKDEKGKIHYVMIEPEESEVTFVKGEEILLTRKTKSKFLGIKNTNKNLSDL